MVFDAGKRMVEDDLRISCVDQMLEEDLRQDVLSYEDCAKIGII